MMGAAAQAAQGVLQLGASFIGHGERRREMQKAQTGFDRAKQRMESLDTSNLYQNLENPFEDLTVNTQQADFMAQQQQAGLAGTMSNLQGAAGGSGIAALAQAMANQQNQNLQQASASIGMQEAANQKMQAQGAAQMQAMERAGASQARNLEAQKSRWIFDQSAQRLGAANEAKQAAMNMAMGGVDRTHGASDYWSETDLNTMAGGGTYIIDQAVPSAPISSRHQVSTNVTSIAYRELSVTKSLDFTAKFIRDGIRPYIGVNVITPAFLKLLNSVLVSQGLFLVREGTLNDFKVVSVAQDTINADTINVTVNVLVKYPVNYIKIKLVF